MSPIKRTTLAILVGLACVLGAAGAASAQVFPPDPDWSPLSCGDGPMFDSVADDSAALDARDLVGDVVRPAGMRAADAQFLYLRLRLDQDPAPGGVFQPFAWGMQFDLDGDVTTYELLMLVDGTGATPAVRLFRNTVTTTPNDAAEPADEPQVAMFAIPAHARSRLAPSSNFGNDADYFLELAVPWSALTPVGLMRDTLVFVWAASSSANARLDGDFACHDAGIGAPTLDGIASGQTIADPTLDSDGDGFTDAEELEAGSDPADADSVPTRGRLEGGGGCTTTGSAAGLVLGLLALRRRRR